MEIPLRGRDGQVRAYAKVSAEDFEAASVFKWHLAVDRYAGRTIRKKPGQKATMQYLHRFIAERAGITGDDIDHVDSDGLNNDRTNLRGCSHAENCRNAKRRKTNRSGFKGVCFYARHQKWMARISVDCKQLFLGYFDTPEEASVAYTTAATIHHGAFARL